jgi:hypothetical protein
MILPPKLTGTATPPGGQDELLFLLPVWDPSNQFLERNGFLPRDRPLARVRCPSVFSPTKWSIRHLSPKELALVYNVPGQVMGVFADLSLSRASALPFLSSAPGALLSSVLATLNPEGQVARTGQQKVNSDHDAEMTNHESSVRTILNPEGQVAGARKKKVTFCLDTEKTQYGSRPVVFPLESYPQQDRARVDFSKAVKADDAENPTFIWDDRVWNLKYHDPVKLASFQREFGGQCPLSIIRSLLLCMWFLSVQSGIVPL